MAHICNGLTECDAVELGVVIGKGGRDIPESQADSYIAGYGEKLSVMLCAKS